MKIAVASDNKKTISEHFGKARGFKIFEIKNNRIINEEYRKNIGKNNGNCGSCDHAIMINNIKDCDIIISFGMGRRIYDDLISNKIMPIVTEENDVKKIVDLFLNSNLINRIDKLH